MVIMESLWTICDGNPVLQVLTYLGGCGYALSTLTFIISLNRFLNDQFGLRFEKKWLKTLFYYVPFSVFALFCITTPITKLVFEVTEDGILQERVLFSTLFYILVWGYIITALIPVFYHLLYARKTNPYAHTNARYMLVFGIMVPLIYSLQWLFLAGLDETIYSQDEIALHAGDRLFLYTDGITEARNPAAAMYGQDRLIMISSETGDERKEQMLKRITEDVNRFAGGAPQYDDMTMVVLIIAKPHTTNIG